MGVSTNRKASFRKARLVPRGRTHTTQSSESRDCAARTAAAHADRLSRSISPAIGAAHRQLNGRHVSREAHAIELEIKFDIPRRYAREALRGSRGGRKRLEQRHAAQYRGR